LLPGNRRRAKAIILLPRAKTKRILLLGRILQGNTITGKTLQGESLKRKLVDFIRSENYYTKFIIFLKREKGSAVTRGTSYEAYDKSGILLSGEYYRRKSQGAVIGGYKKSAAIGRIL